MKWNDYILIFLAILVVSGLFILINYHNKLETTRLDQCEKLETIETEIMDNQVKLQDLDGNNPEVLKLMIDFEVLLRKVKEKKDECGCIRNESK